MKISLEWLGDFIALPQDLDVASLANELTLRTVEVEGWDTVDDDVVLEIDNKSLTNRPDLWGHCGIARELAAIYNVPPLPLPSVKPDPELRADQLIDVIDPAVCRAFSLIRVERSGPVPPTPPWMRRRLQRVGQRSLGLYADLTNYVMLALGQPSHAYDGQALHLPLSVRMAADGEGTLPVLSGQTIELDSKTPVIADVDGPVAIAGVMGGAETQVRPATSSFVFEFGNFDPSVVRTAVLRTGCRTEAAARFEKGPDTQNIERGRDYLLYLVAKTDPNARTTGFGHRTVRPTVPASVKVRLGFLNDRLGTNLGANDVGSLLRPLGFDVVATGDVLHIEVPTWRSTGDVSIPHDILEEVARRIGFDNLPMSTPRIALQSFAGIHNDRDKLERRIREYLAFRCHMQEVLTYPWTSLTYLHAWGSEESVIEIDGAPSPDRRYLRPTLVPNLLEAAQLNLAYQASFDLFELGSVYRSSPRASLTAPAECLPNQPRHVAGVFVGDGEAAVFRRCSGAVSGMARLAWMRELHFELDSNDRVAGSRLVIASGGSPVGTVALVHLPLLGGRSRRNIAVVCFELDVDGIAIEPARTNRYEPLRVHPDTWLDLSVTVPKAVTWMDISAAARGAHPLIRNVEFVDEFRGANLPEGRRSVTMRLTVAADDHTLEVSEAVDARDALLVLLSGKVGAELR